jgi:hypothetical protein
MVRGAVLDTGSDSADGGRGGTAWAAAVAIVFAAIAFASLAIDLSLSVSASGTHFPHNNASLR